MFRSWPSVRIAVVGLILASVSATALAADPLVLFLLRMLREQVISSTIEAGVGAAKEQARQPAASAAAPRPAPAVTEGQWLKGLIDESFAHLGPQQREELHASLMRILGDPKNAEQRATIVAEFTRQAIAMRDAHRQLNKLSPQEMKEIAIEARREYEQLPAEQRQQMLQVLQQGVPGMPRALNEIMLAEFSSVTATR